jgi:hypothetical protein
LTTEIEDAEQSPDSDWSWLSVTGTIKQSLIETRSCGADLVLLVELGRLAANACRVQADLGAA